MRWPSKPRRAGRIGLRSWGESSRTTPIVWNDSRRGPANPASAACDTRSWSRTRNRGSTTGTLDWLWPAAEELGIPVALLADGFLPQFARLADRHPGLKLILDHFGVCRGNLDEAAFASLPEVLALAKYPNVAVKTTGGPQYVSDSFPFVSLQERYRAIHDAFGPRRMFWGTGHHAHAGCSWRECVTAFAEHQPWLPPEDLPWIMGRAIAQWMAWERDDWGARKSHRFTKRGRGDGCFRKANASGTVRAWPLNAAKTVRSVDRNFRASPPTSDRSPTTPPAGAGATRAERLG